MAEPWIRVHARLPEKRVVARCADALRVDHYKALGHLVALWGGVSLNVTGGIVTDIPDSLLERWAGWTGKRGAFAAWVRAEHVDEDGRINEWLDYAGALENRRAKERQRLHDKRELLRNSTHDVAQQTRNRRKVLLPARTVRDETKRDETTNKDLERSRADGADPSPSWVEAARQQWAEKVGPLKHGRVGTALKELVDAHGWEAVSAGMADYLTATPLSKARIEWFAERGAYWVGLAAMPLVDPVTCQPTERMRVVVDGRAA